MLPTGAAREQPEQDSRENASTEQRGKNRGNRIGKAAGKLLQRQHSSHRAAIVRQRGYLCTLKVRAKEEKSDNFKV